MVTGRRAFHQGMHPLNLSDGRRTQRLQLQLVTCRDCLRKSGGKGETHEGERMSEEEKNGKQRAETATEEEN